jgi:hypothetical protein
MKLSALLALAVSGILTCVLVAQQQQTQDEPVRGPDRGTDYRVHGIQVLPATNRPFSARDHILWTRQLEDGSVMKTELYALVARDDQGRIYREHRSFVPLNSNRRSRQSDMVVLDPVAHTRTTCVMRTRRCAISSYHASSTFVLNPDGLFDHGMRFLARLNLGSNTIDGVDVTGTRETLQIAGGAVGGSQTLICARDFWYSRALQVNLSVVRKDPRIGTQELQLVDLSLTTPDPKVFQLPEGFVIQDLRLNSAEPTN